MMLTGDDAEAQRQAALRRARVRLQDAGTSGDVTRNHTSRVECRFVPRTPQGTSAKFDCALADGSIIKVKYGRNPEIQAEIAASRLLTMLGFPADRVRLASSLRCYGCPRFPFVTMRLLTLAGAADLLGPHGHDEGYTDFSRVAVEERYHLPSIETATEEGWAWFELDDSMAPRADLDALRLVAVFLAHWDNKMANQRLVCLDDPPPPAGSTCLAPMAMIQDVGSTFGPSKVNLANWQHTPVWTDRAACAVSMAHLPFGGSTFPDRQISEAGRLLLATRLAQLTASQVRALFADAGFADYQSGTDDTRDLDAWTRAFMHRAGQIVQAGPCPS